MKKHDPNFILVLLLIVFLCPPTFAAKCVRPNGNGGCYDAIQDAIDAVAPGGTVKVYPGMYYEEIDVGKPGITIEGMGNKRTDVKIEGQAFRNFSIGTADVTVRNLTIQNCEYGIIMNGTASNIKIINVYLVNSMYSGIYIATPDNNILIKNCKISMSGYNGVFNGTANGLRIQNTIISHCGLDGIYCGGDELTVDGCNIKNSGLSSIAVVGSRATISNNQLFQAGERGIYATSDFMKVMDNVVQGTGMQGMFLEGHSPVVKNNAVMLSQSHGFYISCEGTCSSARLVGNLSNFNSYEGFYIIAGSSGMLIKKNKAFNNSLNGFWILGNHDKTLVENQSKYNKLHGFHLSYGALENNIASENGTSGFLLRDHNTAIQNKALNNTSIGFQVTYGENTLRRNRAIGNLSHGIRVQGSNNDIINNAALNNFYDICDEGNGNFWNLNDYETECP